MNSDLILLFTMLISEVIEPLSLGKDIFANTGCCFDNRYSKNI